MSVPLRFPKEERILTIKYESLVTEPTSIVMQIMSFLYLEFEADQLRAKSIGLDQRANTKEFSKLKEPINSSSIGRWKSTLSKTEVESIDLIAAKELNTYGYK